MYATQQSPLPNAADKAALKRIAYTVVQNCPGLQDAAREAARDLLEASPLRLTAGATSPHQQVIVLRVLSPVTEPAMQLLRQVWAAWRQEMWALVGTAPRLWNL